MERARKQRGFTIIEVLIVLAVTAAMFILAVASINGKQSETEFQQSVNDIVSSLQQTIDQVAAGDYTNTGNFTCDGTSGNVVITGTRGISHQGSNNGCIFLGKVLQFGVKKTSPQQSQQYITYTLAGLLNNGGSLTAAKPTVVAPGGTIANYAVTSELHDGLTVSSMSYNGTNIGAIAFVNGLGQYPGGTLLSGSQNITLVPINGTVLDATPASTITAINRYLTSSPQNPGNGVQICFASGGTNQSGLVTIGGTGSLTVKLQIKDGTTTCS